MQLLILVLGSVFFLAFFAFYFFATRKRYRRFVSLDLSSEVFFFDETDSSKSTFKGRVELQVRRLADYKGIIITHLSSCSQLSLYNSNYLYFIPDNQERLTIGFRVHSEINHAPTEGKFYIKVRGLLRLKSGVKKKFVGRIPLFMPIDEPQGKNVLVYAEKDLSTSIPVLIR